jgi:hypothetical protein
MADDPHFCHAGTLSTQTSDEDKKISEALFCTKAYKREVETEAEETE